MADEKKDVLTAEQPAPVNLPSIEDTADAVKDQLDAAEKMKADILKDLEDRQKTVDDINNTKTPTVKFSDAAGKPLNKKLHLSEEDESKLTESIEDQFDLTHELYNHVVNFTLSHDISLREISNALAEVENRIEEKADDDFDDVRREGLEESTLSNRFDAILDRAIERAETDEDKLGLKAVKRFIDNKSEGLTEGVPYSDGWDEEALAEVVEHLDALQNISYEISNCVKGSSTNCETYEELGNYILDVINDLRYAAEEIRDLEEDPEEDDDDYDESFSETVTEDSVNDRIAKAAKSGREAAEKRKQSLATNFGINVEDVCCDNCKHWGYNNGLPMNGAMSSKCKLSKRSTGAATFCTSFVPINKAVKKDVVVETLKKIKKAKKNEEFKKLLNASFKEGLNKDDLKRFVEKDSKRILKALKIKE